jgi:hypothetical protein
MTKQILCSDGVKRGRRGDRSLTAGLPLIVITLAMAGCSAASNQAAAVPPPPNGAAVAASQPSGPDPNLLPYPKQSLFEFRGSTEPQGVAMPHPPSTYTPAGQPYSPPAGQAANSAPAAPPAGAAPAPPPRADAGTADYLPYPKQSLFDLFSEKPAAQ